MGVWGHGNFISVPSFLGYWFVLLGVEMGVIGEVRRGGERGTDIKVGEA